MKIEKSLLVAALLVVSLCTACTGQVNSSDALFVLEKNYGFVHDVAFTNDGRKVVSGHNNGMIVIWNAQTGVEENSIDDHTDPVVLVCTQPDGNQIASIDSNANKIVHNLDTMNITWRNARYDFHPCAIRFIANSDGIVTAVGNEISRWRFWLDERPESNYTLSRGGTWPSCFSHDCMHLAYSTGVDPSEPSCYREIRILEMASFDVVHELHTEDDYPTSVTYSSDDVFVAAGLSEGMIMVWQLDPANRERMWKAHDGTVNDLVFLPDSRHILSCGSEGLVLLSEIASGSVVREFSGHNGEVLSVDVSPDGLYGVSGGKDKTVRIWNLWEN